MEMLTKTDILTEMEKKMEINAKTGMDEYLPEDSGHFGEPGGGVSLELQNQEMSGGHVLICLHLSQLQLTQFRVLVHYKQHTPSEEEEKVMVSYCQEKIKLKHA